MTVSLHDKTLGSGEALVILHGLFGSLDNWLTHAKVLSEHFSVFLVDQRNHGRSPHTDSHTYADMAADLHQFLDDNGIYQAHLLGHSMGGKTVMQFAADYPDRVHKLVVADMAPKAYPPHHQAILQALTTLDLTTLETRDQAEQHFIAAGIDGVGERQFLLKGLARDEQKRFFWRFNLPTLVHDYDEVLKNVTFHHPVECSTLFVNGGESRYVKPEDHATILEHFPNAVFHTIPGAGHWLHAEKPDAFLQVVKDFLLL